MSSGKNLLVVIAGPTASGKTALSIELAQYFKTEIINADARQIFQKTNIGTAKPSPEELQKVKHHLISHIPADGTYNAGMFEQDALGCTEEIFSHSKIAILCGGSGMYIQAVCHGFDALPEADDEIRKRLNQIFEEQGIVPLQEMLKEKDEVYYNRCDLKNSRRIIRALEVIISTGKKYSELRSGNSVNRDFKVLKFGMQTDRAQLYQRINERVLKMIDEGLQEEVMSLLPHKNSQSLNTVGYKEWIPFFEGKKNMEETIDAIQQNTRNYAKRQMTWFNKDKEIIWLPPDDTSAFIKIIKENL